MSQPKFIITADGFLCLGMVNMHKADNKGLSEYFKIIRQFIKCHAGEGDAIAARQAVDAIIPAAEHGDVKAQMLLGRYYSWGYHRECDNRKAIHWFEKAAGNGNAEAAMLIMEIYRNDCPGAIDAEQRKMLIREWHRRWFDVLAMKADEGSADAAKLLMNLCIEDYPEDITPRESLEAARKWYDRWIEIMTAIAAKGDSVDKMNLADILLYAEGVPEELLDCFSDEDDERSLRQAISLYKDLTDSNCDDFFKAEAYYKMGGTYNDLGEWKTALLCFKKAARLNCHEAYARIGDAYRYGNGVEQDDTMARKCYRQGADVGEIVATCDRYAATLSPNQKKAVLSFWYDSEMQNGCYSSYLENYPDTNPGELEDAIRTIGNKEMADNYRQAISDGEEDDFEETDNAYYDFELSLCDCLEQFVLENRKVIFD